MRHFRHKSSLYNPVKTSRPPSQPRKVTSETTRRQAGLPDWAAFPAQSGNPGDKRRTHTHADLNVLVTHERIKFALRYENNKR